MATNELAPVAARKNKNNKGLLLLGLGGLTIWAATQLFKKGELLLLDVTLFTVPVAGVVGQSMEMHIEAKNNQTVPVQASLTLQVLPPAGPPIFIGSVEATIGPGELYKTFGFYTPVLTGTHTLRGGVFPAGGVLKEYTKTFSVSAVPGIAPQVRNLTVSLTGGAGSGATMAQLIKRPGELAGIKRIVFDYKGPARSGATSLYICWGMIRSGLSVSFNNGDNLIGRPGIDLSSRIFWNWQPFTVAASEAAFTTVDSGDFPLVGVAVINAPTPDVAYTTRAGGAAVFNVGTVDVWVWVADGALVKIDTDRGITLSDALVLERNFVTGDAIITVDNPFSLQRSVPSVQGVTVTFVQPRQYRYRR